MISNWHYILSDTNMNVNILRMKMNAEAMAFTKMTSKIYYGVRVILLPAITCTEHSMCVQCTFSSAITVVTRLQSFIEWKRTYDKDLSSFQTKLVIHWHQTGAVFSIIFFRINYLPNILKLLHFLFSKCLGNQVWLNRLGPVGGTRILSKYLHEVLT